MAEKKTPPCVGQCICSVRGLACAPASVPTTTPTFGKVAAMQVESPARALELGLETLVRARGRTRTTVGICLLSGAAVDAAAGRVKGPCCALVQVSAPPLVGRRRHSILKRFRIAAASPDQGGRQREMRLA